MSMAARRPILALLTMVSVVSATAAPAWGQAREVHIVDQSAMVFQEVATIPEAGIPVSLLQDAAGFAIIPGVIKAGFIVGGRFGRGVVVVRTETGWSNPIFVTLTGGGVGFQAGAQATDLILIFRSAKSVDNFLRGRGQFTLGADAGVAAGPVGRQLAAGTDVRLRAEILSYSRSRGLFAGVSLEGAQLKIDWQSNVAYYGEVLPTSVILSDPNLPVPASSGRLQAAITRLTTPVVVVPRAPANAAPLAAPGLETLPPASEIPLEPLPPPGAGTMRLQSGELPPGSYVVPQRVLVSTPTGMRPGILMPSSTPGSPAPVLVSSPSGRVIGYYQDPNATTVAAAPGSPVLRSTPQGQRSPATTVPTRTADGWKRADALNSTRIR